MIKSINIESNSMIGEYRKKVLSEIGRLDRNLINLSRLYGIEASCLNSWIFLMTSISRKQTTCSLRVL